MRAVPLAASVLALFAAARRALLIGAGLAGAAAGYVLLKVEGWENATLQGQDSEGANIVLGTP